MKNRLSASLLLAGFMAATGLVSASDSLPIGSDAKVRAYVSSIVEEVWVNVWYYTNGNQRLIFDLISYPYNQTNNGPIEPYMKLLVGQRSQTALVYSNSSTLFGANGGAFATRLPVGLFNNSSDFSLQTNATGGFQVPSFMTNIDVLLTRNIPYEVSDLKWAKLVERDISGNIVSEIDSRTNALVHGLLVYQTLGQSTTNLLYLPRDKVIAGILGEVIIASGTPERQKKYRLDTGARIYTNAIVTMTVSNQMPTVSVFGEASEKVFVEYSTNLLSGWTTITNLTLSSNGSGSYNCQSILTHPARFYRVRYE